LVTSHFIGRTIHFPVDFRLYQRKQNLKDQKDFKTKIELAQELVQEAIDKKLPFLCVILDSWYCNKKVTNFIQERDKDWVAACKSNRLLLMNGKKISLIQYALSLPREAFKKVEVEAKEKKHTFWYFTKSVTMTNLGRVRVVITHDNQDLEGSPSFYLTNKTSWEVKKILGAYLKRWTIETFYRDSKQNLGLEDCELRNIKGIKRHWHLMFLAYSLLQLGSTDTTLSRWLKANITTVGQRCRLATVETLRSFILWVLKQSRNNLDDTQILQMSLSSRSELKTTFC
jgi:SRSO17 transposase